MSEWIKVDDSLPNFNGKVHIRYVDKAALKEREAWYETGNRRFPKGFSLIPKHIIVLEWCRGK